MLLRFCVEGYKGFSNRLVFDLSHPRDYHFNTQAVRDGVVKDALVYGRNGVGKTNLGTALLDARYNVVLEASGRRVGSSYLNADSARDAAFFSYLFRFDGSRVLYEYGKNERGVIRSERLAINDELVYDIDENGVLVQNNLRGYTSGSLVVDGTDLYLGLSMLSYVVTNTPRQLLGPIFSLYQFLQSMQLNNSASLEDDVQAVLDAGRVKELEGFLREHGIDETLEARPDAAGAQVLYMVKNNRAIPVFETCSSGTRALVRLFAIERLEKSAPLFLFLDEFDAHYHHDLSESVLRRLLANDKMQVVATTHNTDLFSNKTLRPDCLFVLSEGGITAAADATTRELREGHNLERLYKAGEFDV